MAIDKGKIDAGQGGRRGHSNMAHWVYSHELKDASRKARRLDAKRAVRSGLAEQDETSARPSRTSKPVTHPVADAFPSGLSGPALRALHGAGIRSLADVGRWSDARLSALHGIGPKALAMLRRAAKSPASAGNAQDAQRRIRAYLEALPPDARRVLKRLRSAIRSAVPRGEDGFSYGIRASDATARSSSGMPRGKHTWRSIQSVRTGAASFRSRIHQPRRSCADWSKNGSQDSRNSPSTPATLSRSQRERSHDS